MKTILLRLMVLSALVLLTTAFAAEKVGTFSFVLLKNGKPLPHSEVIIDRKASLFTDVDGYLNRTLDEGVHRIQVIGRENGGAIVYAKQSFTVVSGQNTQMILTLTSDNKLSIVDVETPEAGHVAMDEETLKSLPKGLLHLSIVSSEEKKPVKGARVFVRGTSIEGVSDDNGTIEVEVPAGEQTISIIHGSFSSQTLNKIEITQEKTTLRVVEMTPASLELEEFVVLVPNIQGSIASVVQEERQSNAITSVLGSEEMSKKGDSNAANALKRVTGVTLVGGKSIFVRGLGERYSNVELNSMPLPSPDPTKRVVPLDIFPSSVIGSMKVQKSATADIPSSFGGGYIDIRTKDSSSEDFIKVEVALKGNNNTGKSVSTYEGSGSDWMGVDDGYRDIPQDLLDATQVVEGERVNGITTSYYTKEEISAFTKEFINRDYGVYDEKLPLGFKIGLSGSKSVEIADEHTISISGGYDYKQGHEYREENYYSYDLNNSSMQFYDNPTQFGMKSQTTSSYEHGGILNIGYRYDDFLSLKYTKLYTLNSDKRTRIVDGILGSNDDQMIYTYLDWEERELMTDQLTGLLNYSLLGKEAEFEFGTQMAEAHLNQPNNFQYIYIYVPFDEQYVINNAVSNHIANKLTSDDKLDSLYLKNKQFVPFFSDEDYVQFGYSTSSKERISRQNKFFLRERNSRTDLNQSIDDFYDEYVTADLPYNDRLYWVSQLFQAADYFDAEVEETTFFLNFFAKPLESVEVMIGARQVDFKQVTYQYQEDRNNPDMELRRLITRVAEDLTLDGIYPSLNVKYKLDDDNQFDFAVSKTYIVPDLREFTDGEYFHPFDVATVRGNPNLENTDIMSYDLKYSHYFTATEMIRAGLYYKQLDKPIEDILIPSSSLPIYSFDNAEKAVLSGLELDGRKTLDFISEELERIYLSGNFSYTDSDVTLREEQLATFTNNHRQLQGLSKIVINAAVGYDYEGRSVVMSYNHMGRRIRKVGLIDDVERYPDHYEIPPDLVDIVWIENMNNGLSFKAKLQNILDSETIWEQGGKVTNEYKSGRKFEISLSYKY